MDHGRDRFTASSSLPTPLASADREESICLVTIGAYVATSPAARLVTGPPGRARPGVLGWPAMAVSASTTHEVTLDGDRHRFRRHRRGHRCSLHVSGRSACD